MTRAIHKMRGGALPISVLIEDFGNVNDSSGFSATWASKAVGSGAGRTIIVGGSMEDALQSAAEINTCTVGGTSCTRRVEESNHNAKANGSAIFTLELTSENGNVDIVLGSSNSLDSWGMSYIVTTGMQTDVPTDTAIGNADATSVATSSTLEGEAGGIAVGVLSGGDRAKSHTWGSSMTEKADLQSGTQNDDHRHSFAFDLLPGGRAAATETVSPSSSDRLGLCTATFR